VVNVGKVEDIELNCKTAYLAGVIIGDGHISNSTKSKLDLLRIIKLLLILQIKIFFIVFII